MALLVVVAGSAWYLKPSWFDQKAPVATGTTHASNTAPAVQAQMGVSATPQPGSVLPGPAPVKPAAAPAAPVATPAAGQNREPVKTQSGMAPAVPAKSEVQAATDNTRLAPPAPVAAPAKTEPTKAHAPAATPPALMQTSSAQPGSAQSGTSQSGTAQSVATALDPAKSTPAAPASLTPAPSAATPSTDKPQALPSVPAVVELPANMSVPDRMAKGMELIGEGKLVDGRRVLSALLSAQDAGLLPMDAQAIRDTLQSVNQKLIFSREIDATDPLVEQYVIKPGDFLAKLARRSNVPFEFLEFVNNTTAKKIQIGQKIKLVKGPFHAVVDKSAYRMDIFVDDPAAPATQSTPAGRLYIRSFPVGHGTDNHTPTGAFMIRAQGKVTNPRWINPQTGEHFEPDDAKNPIGDYWLGLQGTTPETANVQGYGIHGTIDPDSIGKQSSMGCVRLRDEDIKMVYFMLTDGQSTVTILP
jgi:lipoprotein-anchoring transpeptidase ErfK/SrfK